MNPKPGPQHYSSRVGSSWQRTEQNAETSTELRKVQVYLEKWQIASLIVQTAAEKLERLRCRAGHPMNFPLCLQSVYSIKSCFGLKCLLNDCRLQNPWNEIFTFKLVAQTLTNSIFVCLSINCWTCFPLYLQYIEKLGEAQDFCTVPMYLLAVNVMWISSAIKMRHKHVFDVRQLHHATLTRWYQKSCEQEETKKCLCCTPL